MRDSGSNDWVYPIIFAVLATAFVGTWFAIPGSTDLCGDIDPRACRREWAMVAAPIFGAVLAIGAAYLAARPVWSQLRVHARQELLRELKRLNREVETTSDMEDQIALLADYALRKGYRVLQLHPQNAEDRESACAKENMRFVPNDSARIGVIHLPSVLKKYRNHDVADMDLHGGRMECSEAVRQFREAIDQFYDVLNTRCAVFRRECEREYQFLEKKIPFWLDPEDVDRAVENLQKEISIISRQFEHSASVARRYRDALVTRRDAVQAKVVEYERDLFH